MQANAATFSTGRLLPSNPNSSIVTIISGEIKTGDFRRFLDYVARDVDDYYSRNIVISSPGGDIEEATRFGRFFKSTYQSVYVSHEYGECASACFYILSSAVERYFGGRVGVHRPYFVNGAKSNLTLNDTEAKYRRIFTLSRRYLEEMEVPKYLIEKIHSMPSNDIYWLTSDDTDLLGQRARWWEQLLVDRCNFDKRIEQAFLSQGELAPQAHAQAARVGECAALLSRDEGRKNIIKAITTER